MKFELNVEDLAEMVKPMMNDEPGNTGSELFQLIDSLDIAMGQFLALAESADVDEVYHLRVLYDKTITLMHDVMSYHGL